MKNIFKILIILPLLASCSSYLHTRSEDPTQGLIEIPLTGGYSWNPHVTHDFDLGEILTGYKNGYVFPPPNSRKATPPIWWYERPRAQISEN